MRALVLASLLALAAAAGAAAAPPPRDGVVDLLTAANAEIVGPAARARIGGLGAGGGGDLDGDGRAELVVGSPQVGPAGRERAGSVWALAGRARPADADLAAPGPLALARIDGAAPFDELSRSAPAVAGDVNGDGAPDVLVGAPGADSNGRVGSGSAYVVFGGVGLRGVVDLAAPGAGAARIDGAAAGQHAGWGVAPAGDVNGDGLADLLVETVQATVGQRTVVYLVLGSAGFSGLDLASPGGRAVRITREVAGSGIGEADGAGDVNGDGFDDVVVGDSVDFRGRAFVVLGSAAPADVDLAAPAGRAIRILGRPDEAAGIVAGAGDVNGDGFDDIAIGAPAAPTGARLRTGAVDVVRGARDFAALDLASAGARATRILPGAGELLGTRVAGVGDVDGDGADDLAVGATSADFPGRDGAGSVAILRGGPGFFGPRTRTAAPGGGALRLVGPFARSGAGDVGPAGDTDGDGRADVVVAGPGASLKSRTGSGGAWLWGYGPTRPCAAVPRPGGRPVDPSPEPVRLTRQQLLINQRIGQAAIRRVGAVQERLRAGLGDRDVCGGTVSAQSLVATLAPAFGPEVALPVAAPRPITTAPPSGDPGDVRLTAEQLRINQRIYQVALLRARALLGRLARLTGGDVAGAALSRGRLTPGLTAVATGPAPSLPPSSASPRIPDRRDGGRVTLSAAQLGINQRIAQAAVRVANDTVSQIERGLVNDNFRDRGIGAGALAPGVVTGSPPG
jgi:hypothetical protein